MTNNQLFKQISLLPSGVKDQISSYLSLLSTKAFVKKNNTERTFGYAKDFFIMADDFDEPLEDFKDYI